MEEIKKLNTKIINSVNDTNVDRLLKIYRYMVDNVISVPVAAQIDVERLLYIPAFDTTK